MNRDPDNDGVEPLRGELERLRRDNEDLREALATERALRDEILQSASWRLGAPAREIVRWARALIRERRSRTPERWVAPLGPAAYSRWVASVEQSDVQTAPVGSADAARSTAPRLTFLVAVEHAREDQIASTITSVLAQTHPHWQLCLVDAGSTVPHVSRALASHDHDPRVSVRRSGPGRTVALREALEAATGMFVAVLDAGDVLHPTALADMVTAAMRYPDWVLVYSDEDRLDATGRRTAPVFKTGWNPDLLLASPYLGRLCAWRRDLVQSLGGFRDKPEGAPEYDLALRAMEQLGRDRVGHIPKILCHRGHAPEADDAAASRRTAQAYLEREKATVRAIPGLANGHRIDWPKRDVPVSVIVPTHDRPDLLRRVAADVLAEPEPQLELLVVDHASRDRATHRLLDELRRDPRVTVLSREGPFNWSSLNNAAAAQAKGEVLVFLNDDIEALEAGWLGDLVAQAMRPEIGAVGAKLVFGDGSLQHAGIWLGPGSQARHLLRLSAGYDVGYLGQLALTRNLSAVSGACLATRRGVFDAVGTFDEAFASDFNDVDFCLRLEAWGYRVLWLPHVRLRHLESASRGRSDTVTKRLAQRAEHALLCRRWGARLDRDVFRNPNLDLIGEEVLALTFPPSL